MTQTTRTGRSECVCVCVCVGGMSPPVAMAQGPGNDAGTQNKFCNTTDSMDLFKGPTPQWTSSMDLLNGPTHWTYYTHTYTHTGHTIQWTYSLHVHLLPLLKGLHTHNLHTTYTHDLHTHTHTHTQTHDLHTQTQTHTRL
jgi:hypothetical protein